MKVFPANFIIFLRRKESSSDWCWKNERKKKEEALSEEKGNMKKSPYLRFDWSNLILRDELAVERTLLSNERTLLAYLRSGAALLVSYFLPDPQSGLENRGQKWPCLVLLFPSFTLGFKILAFSATLQTKISILAVRCGQFGEAIFILTTRDHKSISLVGCYLYCTQVNSSH